MVDLVSGEVKAPKGFRRMVEGMNEIQSMLREEEAFLLPKEKPIGSMGGGCKMRRVPNGMFQASMGRFTVFDIPNFHGTASKEGGGWCGGKNLLQPSKLLGLRRKNILER